MLRVICATCQVKPKSINQIIKNLKPVDPAAHPGRQPGASSPSPSGEKHGPFEQSARQACGTAPICSSGDKSLACTGSPKQRQVHEVWERFGCVFVEGTLCGCGVERKAKEQPPSQGGCIPFQRQIDPRLQRLTPQAVVNSLSTRGRRQPAADPETSNQFSSCRLSPRHTEFTPCTVTTVWSVHCCGSHFDAGILSQNDCSPCRSKLSKPLFHSVPDTHHRTTPPGTQPAMAN